MFLGLRALTLTVGTHSVETQCTDVKIVTDDPPSSQICFGATASMVWSLQGTYLQSTAANGVDELLEAHQGETMVVTVKPAGGAAATADTPVWTGSVVIKYKGGQTVVGGAASEESYFVSDFSWNYVAKPVKTVA